MAIRKDQHLGYLMFLTKMPSVTGQLVLEDLLLLMYETRQLSEASVHTAFANTILVKGSASRKEKSDYGRFLENVLDLKGPCVCKASTASQLRGVLHSCRSMLLRPSLDECDE